MDTSKEYIEMCKQAKEIQNHFVTIGDYYYENGDIEICDNSQIYSAKMQKSMIFLPKQDQLQDMVWRNGLWAVKLDGCRAWYIKTNFDFCINSIEQLWLTFVMDQNYIKKWNGIKWIEK